MNGNFQQIASAAADGAINAVCESNGYTRGGMSASTANGGGGCGCDKCKVAGGGACARQPITGSAVPGRIPMWDLPGAVPECYSCDGVDVCLAPLLAEARSRFDDHAWMQLWVNDPTVIHIDQIISPASAPYTNTFPIGSNAKIILVQEAAQQLPFLPGMFKVDAKFSGSNASNQVIVRIFTGPRGLTNLTSTSGLVKIGNDLKLADFECKDDCYFLLYPRLMGCLSSGIPDTRQIYVELETLALGGGNNLDSINFSLLKRGSRRFVSTCRQFGLDW